MKTDIAINNLATLILSLIIIVTFFVIFFKAAAILTNPKKQAIALYRKILACDIPDKIEIPKGYDIVYDPKTKYLYLIKEGIEDLLCNDVTRLNFPYDIAVVVYRDDERYKCKIFGIRILLKEKIRKCLEIEPIFSERKKDNIFLQYDDRIYTFRGVGRLIYHNTIVELMSQYDGKNKIERERVDVYIGYKLECSPPKYHATCVPQRKEIRKCVGSTYACTQLDYITDIFLKELEGDVVLKRGKDYDVKEEDGKKILILYYQ